MQRGDKGRNKNKKEAKVTPLGMKIAPILLVFCGLVALISLIYILSAPMPKLSAQAILALFALSAFPIAYGIRMRKKWAFYASLILFESLIIIYPLITAFSPPRFLEENRICLFSFIAVGIIAVPILISKKSHFIETSETAVRQKGVKLHELIERLPIFNILYIIFGISLIIRTVLPYNRVFGGEMVMFGSDDPVFHLRLIENELFGNHFPHRIYFDPYTLFPHGDPLHFAPLYDQLPAFFTWLIGLGAPTYRLMETVVAYYPAVLGALVVFPVYFIGKEIYSKEVGLLSAFLIAILPGFLFRSILGAADHHQGEVLFSTIAMMFLVMALKRAKASGITFEHIAKRDWTSLKTPLVFIFLASFSFGLYALTWVGCVLFVFIVFVTFFAQYLIEHLRGNSTDYLCMVGVPVFLIPLLMIAPFLKYSGMYSSTHVASMLIGALWVFVLLVLSIISLILSKKGIAPRWFYLVMILAVGILVLSFLSAVFSSTFTSLMNAFGWVKYGIAMQVLGEMHPMTLDAALGHFSTCFYISLAAFAFVIYGIIKKWRPEETLFLVWSFINLLILGVIFDMFGMSPPPIGQNRFVYYYAVNVALLCGLFAVQVTKRGFAFFSETKKEKKEGKRIKGKQKKEERQRQKVESKKKEGAEHGVGATKIKKYSTINRILVLFVVIFIIFYPFPLNVANPFPGNMPENFERAYYQAKGGPSVFPTDWYESLFWMRNNTPDPGVDYYELYEEPPYNKTTNKIEDYKYPDSAYGVMSWWDYGHVITLYAHRIPNSNPFQGGIGGRNEDGSIRPGACTFFVSRDEEEANWILDELGTRYVISDFEMADAWGVGAWLGYTPKFSAITVWAGNPQYYNSLSRYYNTMEARLHIFDGASVDIDGESIPALAHYRLVHETPTFMLPLIIIDENEGNMYWRPFSGDYNRTKSQAQILHGYLFSIPVGVGIEEVLDNESIPEMLKSVFNSTGIPLSEDSGVVKSNENRWTIRDEINKNMFTINKREGKLDVYLYGVKTGQPNIKAWTPEYIEPVSFVKVFEYVKGARIEGTAPNGSIVEIATNVTTNQGREFVYAERMMSNGSYEFVVPYSTEGPMEGGTNFDVFTAPYKMRAGHVENATVVWDVEKEISVPEEAVMEGKTIRVDLLS
jgi:oligosaccharyl transferase (archaeosortase A-associated)